MDQGLAINQSSDKVEKMILLDGYVYMDRAIIDFGYYMPHDQ